MKQRVVYIVREENRFHSYSTGEAGTCLY